MSDPSLLVTRPTATDPSLAPAGRDLLYVLAPAPNLARGDDRLGRDRRRLRRADARHRPRPAAARLGDDAEVLRRRQPGRLGAPGHGGGHPVRAGAHLRPDRTVPSRQHRARHRQRGARRLSTVPGVGVPTAMMSGRLAADRITGVVERGHRDAGPSTWRSAVMIRSELDAAGIRDPSCATPTDVPRTQRRSTAAPSSSPPGCSRPRSARPCTRCTGSPGWPTTSSTTSTPSWTSPNARDRLQPLPTQFFDGGRRRCATIRCWRPSPHTARRYGIARELFDDFLAPCGWT